MGKIALAFTTYSTLCCLSLGKAPTSHQLEQRGDKATPVKGVDAVGDVWMVLRSDAGD